MTVKRVALLTAGGYAPCLSSAVGGLIERYTELVPDVEIIAYKHGYWGLLSGEKIVVDDEVRAKAGILHNYGGSPIGNSRVKLTNTKDLVKRGLVKEGEDPLQVAAEQLRKDGVDVLHTIGGDDTNTTAADLAALAAADRAAHGTHMACGQARITAEANDASLITCDLTGHIVDVVVTVPSTVLDHQVHARARAGPVHKADPPEEEE